MINQTTVLRHIRMKRGFSHNISPITDEDILTTIQQETLLTFSKYYPHMFFVEVTESNDLLEREKGIYYLKTGDLEVLGVSKIFRTSQYLYDKWPIYNVDAFNYQMYSDLRSIVTVPSTFLFLPPNRIEVFPKFYTPADFTIEVKCIHPPHFNTIPLSLRDQFLELADLDVRIAIWAILKNISNINSAFGPITINTDDYSNAEDTKKALLEKWDGLYLQEPFRKKIFIA
jgi:hypothetical protein